MTDAADIAKALTPAQRKRMLRSHFGDEDFTLNFARSVFELRKSRVTALRKRKGICSECPVRDGMYQPYAELLRLLPEPERVEYLDRWWCHTDTRFCCTGAREYAAAARAQDGVDGKGDG